MKTRLTCIVCEKPIELTRGKSIDKCSICNNAVHSFHLDTCTKCKNTVCMNDIRYDEIKALCKKCTKLTKTGRPLKAVA